MGGGSQGPGPSRRDGGEARSDVMSGSVGIYFANADDYFVHTE